MPDPITRLNAALEGRYRIERELGEGGMAGCFFFMPLGEMKEPFDRSVPSLKW